MKNFRLMLCTLCQNYCFQCIFKYYAIIWVPLHLHYIWIQYLHSCLSSQCHLLILCNTMYNTGSSYISKSVKLSSDSIYFIINQLYSYPSPNHIWLFLTFSTILTFSTTVYHIVTLLSKVSFYHSSSVEACLLSKCCLGLSVMEFMGNKCFRCVNT